MNKDEARSILSEFLAHYRSVRYADLAAWVREGRVDTAERVAASGARYQLEVQFFWDGKPGAAVRVLASIDDNGIRAFVPICDDFIVSPDGHFVGE